MKQECRFVLIGGSGRCGSTALGQTLSKHPSVAYVHEGFRKRRLFGSYLDCERRWDDRIAPVIHEEMEKVRASSGKKVLVEKSPQHSRWFHHYHRLLPGCFRYVCMFRDPLDTIASLKSQKWWNELTSIQFFCDWWRDYSAIPSRLPYVIPVRYEHLAKSPHETGKKLLADLGLGCDDLSMFDDSTPDHMGKWKKSLTGAEADEIVQRLKPEMEALGYLGEPAGLTSAGTGPTLDAADR